VARIGSGSAPRSLLGGFVALRIGASGTSCEQLLPPDAWPLDIVIAVTTESAKPVSSREGMNSSRETSPYYRSWLATHHADMEQAEASLRDRDFFRLADVAEHNCLKMHAVMLSARPALMYWTPTTVACMSAISALRRDGVPVFFTIDAGPQVKAICLPEASEQVAATLARIDGVLRILSGGLGTGPCATR
jgi:diphosphomevalonate decarboxylase